MKVRSAAALIFLCLIFNHNVLAQSIGTAGGSGTIERFKSDSSGNFQDDTETFTFSPKFSFAYKGKADEQWLFLSDQTPPVAYWKAGDRLEEDQQEWCRQKGAGYLLLKLVKHKPDMVYLCPGNGQLIAEMISTINGLDSTALSLAEATEGRLRGGIRRGTGSCPAEDGEADYCENLGSLEFNAPIVELKK